MLYRVTSLAYDPAAGKAYYTADNYAYRDLMEIDVASGKSRMLLRDARIGDIVFNPRDKSLWGLRHLNGFVTLVRSRRPTPSWTQIHTFAYGEVPFDLDISPDGALLSASVGRDQRRAVGAGLPHRRPGRRARSTPMAQFKLGTSTPGGLRLLARRPLPVRQLATTPASRTSIASSSPPAKVEAVSNAATGFFRPIPRPTAR